MNFSKWQMSYNIFHFIKTMLKKITKCYDWYHITFSTILKQCYHYSFALLSFQNDLHHIITPTHYIKTIPEKVTKFVCNWPLKMIDRTLFHLILSYNSFVQLSFQNDLNHIITPTHYIKTIPERLPIFHAIEVSKWLIVLCFLMLTYNSFVQLWPSTTKGT